MSAEEKGPVFLRIGQRNGAYLVHVWHAESEREPDGAYDAAATLEEAFDVAVNMAAAWVAGSDTSADVDQLLVWRRFVGAGTPYYTADCYDHVLGRPDKEKA